LPVIGVKRLLPYTCGPTGTMRLGRAPPGELRGDPVRREYAHRAVCLRMAGQAIVIDHRGWPWIVRPGTVDLLRGLVARVDLERPSAPRSRWDPAPEPATGAAPPAEELRTLLDRVGETGPEERARLLARAGELVVRTLLAGGDPGNSGGRPDDLLLQLGGEMGEPALVVAVTRTWLEAVAAELAEGRRAGQPDRLLQAVVALDLLEQLLAPWFQAVEIEDTRHRLARLRAEAAAWAQELRGMPPR
jgi:hypothetical protein